MRTLCVCGGGGVTAFSLILVMYAANVMIGCYHTMRGECLSHDYCNGG